MRLFISTLLFCLSFAAAQAEEVKILSPEETYAQASSGELLMIDVRRPSEWEATGIAEPAIPMSMHGPEGIEGLVQQITQYVDGDKSRRIAVICRSGSRSAKVAAALESNGFTHIYDVTEGTEGNLLKRGWIKRGLPIKTYTPEP
ncbi:MAG: rhodanese-like domain-containing protein [Sphingomonadales bacterium]|jgi:rhodanese-related sulfurtransferase